MLTKEEFKNHLSAIMGDNTDDEVLDTVTELIDSYNESVDANETAQNALTAEKERFKKRFFEGRDDDNGGNRGGGFNPATDDEMLEFFKGI